MADRWRRWAPVVAVALALGVGIPQAIQDLRSDDWAYVAWVRGTAPGAFLTDPPPYPYLRPLNALVWEVGVRLGGTSPWAVEGPLLLLWGLLLAAVYGVGAQSGGPAVGLAAVALALLMPELRGLPNWRSWLTTTGGLAGVWGAMWLAGRGRPGWAWLAAAVGGGFKEVAWVDAAAGLAGVGRVRLAVGAAVGFLVQGVWLAPAHPPGEVGVQHLSANLVALARTLWGWGWPAALLGVALLAPPGAWRRRSTGLLLAAVVAFAPALLFYLWSPYYVLEGALFLLLGLLPVAAAAVAASPFVRGLAVGLTVAVLGRPGAWDDYGENVPWQQRRLREGRALVASAGVVSAVWAPGDDVGPCGLARDLLVDAGAAALPDRPPEALPGDVLADCLVVRR